VENFFNTLRDTGMLDELKAKWFESGFWLPKLP
jgi:hypothetical protein